MMQSCNLYIHPFLANVAFPKIYKLFLICNPAVSHFAQLLHGTPSKAVFPRFFAKANLQTLFYTTTGRGRLPNFPAPSLWIQSCPDRFRLFRMSKQCEIKSCTGSNLSKTASFALKIIHVTNSMFLFPDFACFLFCACCLPTPVTRWRCKCTSAVLKLTY